MQASPHPAGCWGGEEGQKEREGDQGRGTPWAAGTILEPPAKQRGWEVMGWERDLKAGLSVHTQTAPCDTGGTPVWWFFRE